MVDTPIGTNSPNYELQPTDVGATIFCRVTATNAVGSAQAFSNTVGPVAAASGDTLPANAGGANLPAITPTTTVEGTLYTTTNGTWTGTPAPTFTRQWKSGATNVGTGATTYTTVAGDVGKTITCVVTATNTVGSANATSNAVGPVTAAGGGASTWDVAQKTAGVTLSGDNLTATVVGTSGLYPVESIRSTVSRDTGKKYFEVTIDTTCSLIAEEFKMMVGLADSTHVIAIGSIPGATNDKGFYVAFAPALVIGWLTDSDANNFSGTTVVDGDVIGLACDLDAHLVEGVYKNGTLLTPAFGTPMNWGGVAVDAVFPFVCMQWQEVGPGALILNTAGPFALATLPTDYVAWG